MEKKPRIPFYLAFRASLHTPVKGSGIHVHVMVEELENPKNFKK